MSTPEEKMLEYMKALGVPAVKNLEELKEFMSDYGSGKGKANPPRIPVFYGEAGKGEISYQGWRCEVKALGKLVPKTYTEEMVLQAIRRSLRGHAADQLRYIGESPTIEEILHRFNSTYGTVETPESILKKFYACKQNPDELVTDYCARLEEIHSQAVEMEVVKEGDGMLKRVFFRGLIPRLKHISQYKFETVKEYTKFKVEVRQLENELEEEDKSRGSSEKVKTKCHSVNKKEEKAEQSKIEEQLGAMTSMMEKLNTRMEQLEQQQQQDVYCQQLHSQQAPQQSQPRYSQQTSSYTEQSHANTAGPYTHYSDYQQPQYSYPPQYFGQQPLRPVGLRGQKHHRGPRGYRPRGQGPFRGQGRGQGSYRVQRPLAANTFQRECFNCHEIGHIARDCPLNN